MEEFQIKKLRNIDIKLFTDLIKLFEDVFEMDKINIPSEAYLIKLLENTDFHVFVALKNYKVVAGLTTYTIHQYYEEKPIAYIYDLAVDTIHQRKGIGRKLIEENNKYFKNKGFQEVFVQADKVDNYAINFYRKTNPNNEDEVLHYSYIL